MPKAMKKNIVFVVILSLLLNACNGQNLKPEQKEENKKPTPETNIKVNKEYDEEGNLVRYDSVYTSYYSNIEGDTLMRDSIFEAFKKSFDKSYPFSSEPFFENLFFEDSLLMYDFYKDDFFQSRYYQNPYKMDELFREMDSLKNLFFRPQFETPKTDKDIQK
jgi:hypothetical protein